MRVLLVGSGGREHALAWKIAQSPDLEALIAAPGNTGMSVQARCVPGVSATDIPALVALARSERIDLVVIGPEDPLAGGLADRLREAGIAAFGPTAAAAQLEASKAFAKEFMARHGIPTAGFAVFDEIDAARAHVRERGGACVVKADGLAAGKGVAVCGDPHAALAALDEIMGDRRFGAAGDRVVIEDLLEGVEASFYAITDGKRVTSLAAAQDHKRALDADRGENTGGMGAYSPTPALGETTEKRVLEEIVHPTIRGLAEEGYDYRGVLYVGLMIDSNGDPRVVEFNVRFGDPETQPLVVRMRGDFLPILAAAARGVLDPGAVPLDWADAAVCVVLASAGYPRDYETGKAIHGLDSLAADPNLVVFHAGTRRGPDGGFVTAGGRVLGVTARGATVAEARSRAYAGVEQIEFEGRQFRTDIALQAVAP